MMKPLLELKGLTKSFGGVLATDNVHLSVAHNSFHAIIGPNGAGKTTLLSLLSGEIVRDSGSILFDGCDIGSFPTSKRILAGIGRSFQITSVFNELSVQQNIALAWQAHDGHSFRFIKSADVDEQANAAAEDVLSTIGLLERGNDVVANLSHGEKRVLEVGMALAGDPKILVLDEPMAGMGIEDSARMVSLLRQLGQTTTILMVEHDMDAVFSLATQLTVLVDGRVIASGSPETIRNDDTVRKAYLGDGTEI